MTAYIIHMWSFSDCFVSRLKSRKVMMLTLKVLVDGTMLQKNLHFLLPQWMVWKWCCGNIYNQPHVHQVMVSYNVHALLHSLFHCTFLYF